MPIVDEQASKRRAPRPECNASTPAPPARPRTARSASLWPMPPAGRALIDRRLYLLEHLWLADPARCAQAGIPAHAGVRHQARPGHDKIVAALEAGVEHPLGDPGRGLRPPPHLRETPEEHQIGYVLAIAAHRTSSWTGSSRSPPRSPERWQTGTGTTTGSSADAKVHRLYARAWAPIDPGPACGAFPLLCTTGHRS